MSEFRFTPELEQKILDALKHNDSVELKKTNGKIAIVGIERKLITTVTTG